MVRSESRRASRTAAIAGSLAAIAASCSPLPYPPCPVELQAPLPADAFAIARRVVAARFGPLAEVDAESFRLQSGWLPVDDPPGQRRASVFRDGTDLAVLVEARSLVEPVFGLPHWGSIRGDAAAERELAALLRDALSP